MGEPLEIVTLGNLVLRRGEVVLTDILSSKAAALIVFLACTGHSQTRLHLAELFWFERSEEQALSNLRTLLTRIRPYFGNNLLFTRDTVSFNPGQPYHLDFAELHLTLARVRSKNPGQGELSSELIGQLEEALRLYQGGFLAGFYVSEANGFEEWAGQERENLQRQVIEALKIASSYHLRQGDFIAAYRWTSRILELDPFDEEALRQQMLLLARSGQRVSAINNYKAYQQHLAKELDIAPEARTTDLYEQIKNDRKGIGTNIQAISSGQVLPGLISESNKLTQLKRISLFAETPEYLLTELEQRLEEIEVKAGQTIFEKGELGQCLYVIVEGQVRVHDGQRIINDLGPRDIFGEMAVIDSAPRLASVIALTDTRLWRLEQSTLYQLMSERIEVAQAIIKMLTKRLRERVQEVVELNALLVTSNSKLPRN